MKNCDVWKYAIPPAAVTRFEFPSPSRPLSVGTQGGVPVMWVLTGSGPPEPWDVYPVMTGRPMDHVPDDAEFVGTTTAEGLVVVHVFARKAST